MSDQQITCNECGDVFAFTAAEQDFYAQKGLASPPKRCKACRQARKAAHGGPPQQAGRGRRFSNDVNEYRSPMTGGQDAWGRPPYEPQRRQGGFRGPGGQEGGPRRGSAAAGGAVAGRWRAAERRSAAPLEWLRRAASAGRVRRRRAAAPAAVGRELERLSKPGVPRLEERPRMARARARRRGRWRASASLRGSRSTLGARAAAARRKRRPPERPSPRSAAVAERWASRRRAPRAAGSSSLVRHHLRVVRRRGEGPVRAARRARGVLSGVLPGASARSRGPRAARPRRGASPRGRRRERRRERAPRRRHEP